MDKNQEISQSAELLNQKRKNSKLESPQKENKKPKQEKQKNFRIIEPYRSLGIYTDNNKIHFFKRGIDRFMLTSNKYSFIVYNLEKLRIERISPPIEKKITALYPYKTKIFTGIGNKVQLWEKIHIIKEFPGNLDDPNDLVKQIMTFENIVLFITLKGDLFIYEIHSGLLISKLEKKIEYFMHPITYLNKILFSTKAERYEDDLNKYEPNLILYDINEEKEIINYKDFFINKKSKINLFEQSPVIDIIAINFTDGDIILFNMKKTKIILKLFSQYNITSMAFSCCNTMSHSLLVTGCDNGIVNIWDLNKKSIHYTINNDFTNISNILLLPEEPIMIITSEEDNSIKMYKFEKNTSIPQLFKFRGGHTSPPNHIRFYGENANEESIQLLSCDKNNLRNISLLSEQISKEFSSKKFSNSLKNKHDILNFDFNEFRERDWGNILLLISDYEKPLIYSYENSCINETQPKLKTKNSFCTCVCISICGNFGFCGFNNGNIEKFNMQSGLSRWVLERAHGIGNEVTDIKSDGLNSMLISISKSEKKIKFWEILDHSLIKEFNIDSFPRKLEINRDTDLICTSLENNFIFIYDKSQLALVRKFNILLNDNYTENDYIINDFCISKDSNWLLCITSNKSLKIYDIISTNLIEWVIFDKIPLSLNLSPNSLYIALSFEQEKGIYLYINRTLFLDLENIETVVEPIQCTLASFKAKIIKNREEHEENNNNNNDNDNKNDENEDFDEREKYMDIPEENKELISLSNENNIKYKLLNDIELLQERNAPKVKDKKKEQAPFFLFNINDIIEGNLPQKESKKDLKEKEEESPEFLNLLKNYSHFTNEKKITEKRFINTFHKNKKNNDENSDINNKKEGYILTQLLIGFKNNKIKSSEITKFLNGLNPYISDLEIRSLDPLFNLGDEDYLLMFSEYILNEFKSNNNNYEMLQAYLNRFIKIYSDDIINDIDIKKNLEKINEINAKKYNDLEEIYNSTMCLVSHFGNIQI